MSHRRTGVYRWLPAAAVLLALAASRGNAADTGYKTGFVPDESAWSGTFSYANLSGSDDQRAIATTFEFGPGEMSYDLGLGVPAGATILGIQVRVEGSSTTGATANFRVALTWDNGRGWTTAKVASFASIIDSPAILGSSTDLWGRAWSVTTWRATASGFESPGPAATACRSTTSKSM